MMLSFDTVLRRWWRNAEKHPDLPRQLELPELPDPPDEPWQSHLHDAGVPNHLSYPSTTLGRILDQTADRFGDNEALLYNHHRWTYRELLAAVNRMAGGLALLGVRRGERVLMVLPNCPEFVIAFLAIQKLGAIVVNAGPLMGRDDLQTVVAMTNPRVAIGLDLLAPTLHFAARGSTLEHFVFVSLQIYQPMLKRLGYQLKLWHSREGAVKGIGQIMLGDLLDRAPSRPPTVEPDINAVAVLQATGGTTGTLKLAQLTHRSLLANAMQVSVWESAHEGQERCFAVVPMFHVYGLTLCLVSSIFTGSAIILMTRFSAAEMLELIRRHKPTICPIVPAICDAISDLLEKEQAPNGDKTPALSTLRLCISGAAPLSRETAERFQRLTGATVVEGYGLTEASPVTHAGLPHDYRVGSIGMPVCDTRAKIVDFDDPSHEMPIGEPGELLISGPQLMTGYFANPEQTAKALIKDRHGDTWLRTGDVARMDADGFFYILDRKKDMIIRSGMKVYPGKVERVLKLHQAVREAAVVGRADPHHTERVVAVIAPLPEEDQRKQLTDELRALCREHLAPYEVPQAIEFVEKLPRSALGKLLKRELRKEPALRAEDSISEDASHDLTHAERDALAPLPAEQTSPSATTPPGDARPSTPPGNGNGNGNGLAKNHRRW